MSAILCGKRSFIFEEIPSPSSSSPVSKRIRYSSFSPPRSGFLLLDHIFNIFPHMDKKLIEQALENSGRDLDLAIKSLNDLRLVCTENDLAADDTFLDAPREPSNQSQVNGVEEGGSAEDVLAPKDPPVDGAEWVDFFVREMDVV